MRFRDDGAAAARAAGEEPNLGADAVAGEARVGKSRLIAEFRGSLAKSRVRVALGQSSNSPSVRTDRSSTFWRDSTPSTSTWCRLQAKSRASSRWVCHLDIAQRLSISHKTVEKRLGAVYQKLGVSSRAQLAAWVTRSQEGNR